ncbi:MAG: hypothetical protein R3E79_37905 [Caldilineaceae bacterium]
MTLDQRYLTQLYQLAQLPKILRLPVNGFFRLLDLLDLPTARTLADVRLLSGWAAWMRTVGISVEEIDFFANDTPSARFALTVADAALRDLAASGAGKLALSWCARRALSPPRSTSSNPAPSSSSYGRAG